MVVVAVPTRVVLLVRSPVSHTPLLLLQSRAKITGRVVPQHLLESSLEQVPLSVARLAPSVDFCAELFNGKDGDDNLQLKNGDWDTFQQQWQGICGSW